MRNTNVLSTLLAFLLCCLSLVKAESHFDIGRKLSQRDEGTGNKYPAKSHARRVAKQLNLTEGLIYLNGEQFRNNEDSDMPAFFRQKRYFYYLTGYDYPDAHVTYDIKADILTIWILKPDPKEVLWSGPSPTPQSILLAHDVDMANYTSDGLNTTIIAYASANPSAKIHILHNYFPPIPSELRSFCDNTKLQYAIDVCRVVKDDYEIELIRRATEISSQAHTKIMSQIDLMTSERDIEAMFISECIRRGAKKLAYDTIACSGKNNAILHYVKNDQELEGKQLVLIDAAAEYGLYASDITRTFPINGRFTKEAAEIYSLVYEMQQTVFKMVKPGVKWRDCHLAAADVALDGLMKLGVLTGNKTEIVKSQIIGKVFFPHGLGHGVGLEVHDTLYSELISAGPSSRGKRTPVLALRDFDAYTEKEIHNLLKPNMVITAEPGIYFNQPLYEDYLNTFPNSTKYINEKVLAKYWDVGGVRIEDCIRVTENGFENLTTAPKKIVDIERIARSRR
ncbi:hypothetical protein H072_11291 [Dactylellina haptotyla CBS 200.50]|uniref:Xaa-Pro aminopeptidase n=1 Tax=Dactylellina haptotyla (strain CBS 200.50) TaxID=1284197 RepID=S7ZX51_DACHA|nr:hypothetical protein H072_11291 [Dactylellina haptotyla CBS 200.50]